ncbi:peroxiredoxin family protein [Pseudalkalibacillus berkeleyi]|uniref:TlpA family protein disulfide reductase n=1 Tax=Pseudalkalibacillus berkeleyi TaxID=1069813 RepID=A0ABS9H6S9_9BACL|nr:TlpA disulfide reductase family protein [Pseudalkalibacillus berkeleyi]MCF6139390.1 TlpA family protein disulfide reductase [Pseudalkalibacillus berkeleyi]
MSYFEIGSVVLRTEWITLVVAAIVGLFTVWLILHEHECKKQIVDMLFNVFMTGILVWKLSIALFQPIYVIENPMALLYFTGGAKGVLLAFVVSITLFVYQTKRKQLYSESLISSILVGFLVGSGFKLITEWLFGLNISILQLSTFIIGLLVFLIFSMKQHGFARGGKLLIVVGLVGLISWSVYNHLLQKQVVQDDSNVQGDISVGVKIGNRAPHFSLKTSEDETISLADLKGKKVVVNFWATWCPPCKAEVPEMVKFYDTYEDEDLEILAVNLTNTEKGMNDVRRFKEAYNMNFPILLDEDGAVASAYQAFTIPTTYVLDENGVIIEKMAGPMSYEWMEKNILSE